MAVALTACASTTTTSTGSGDSASKSSSANEKSGSDCGTKATDDCTPHVSSTGSVRVDALVWRVSSVKTARTIGDQTYGAGAKASGRFVILKLKVHSDKNDSATLSNDVVKLEVNGNTYDADNDGTVAATLSGDDKPFFLDTIGPDSDRTGIVVFDVPKKVLSKKVEARFNELGFGSTHGYIRLRGLNS